jgi:hypothetical protein
LTEDCQPLERRPKLLDPFFELDCMKNVE